MVTGMDLVTASGELLRLRDDGRDDGKDDGRDGHGGMTGGLEGSLGEEDEGGEGGEEERGGFKEGGPRDAAELDDGGCKDGHGDVHGDARVYRRKRTMIQSPRERHDEQRLLRAARVGVGCLGVTVGVELALVATYHVRRRLVTLPLGEFVKSVEAIVTSVSVL